MSTYHLKLEGTVADLPAVAAQINFVEAKSNRFVSSELAWVAPSFTNLTAFERLPGFQLLERVTVTKHDAPTPEAHTKVWTGAMIVAGRTEWVTVWRAS